MNNQLPTEMQSFIIIFYIFAISLKVLFIYTSQEAYKNTVDYSTDADFEDFVLNKLAKAETSKQLIVESLPDKLHDNQEIHSGQQLTPTRFIVQICFMIAV